MRVAKQRILLTSPVHHGQNRLFVIVQPSLSPHIPHTSCPVAKCCTKTTLTRQIHPPVAQAGGLWAIFKNVAQVPQAAAAADLRQ